MTSQEESESFKRSSWITVTQAMIDQFAAATLDPDPMHIDPVWARTQGPYGETIAFGFLTMSLLTYLHHQALQSNPVTDPSIEGVSLNYGFDRLRLIAPVRTGQRIRGAFREESRARTKSGHVVLRYECMVEIEHESKPALAATWLVAWMPPDSQAETN